MVGIIDTIMVIYFLENISCSIALVKLLKFNLSNSLLVIDAVINVKEANDLTPRFNKHK